MSAIAASSLDHVALWLAERDVLEELLCGHLGLHVIDRTETFTLVGVDARRGKITLFVAKGPREAGVLDRVALRVRDPDAAAGSLPSSIGTRRRDGAIEFEGPEGLGMALVEGEGPDFDLDHVVLRVPDPDRTAEALAELGFSRGDGRLAVADREVRLERGDGGTPERPLLNHLALLVGSAAQARAAAERRGLEIDRVVDAENTFAVFVRGPDGILVEYVEHKPGFSLV